MPPVTIGLVPSTQYFELVLLGIKTEESNRLFCLAMLAADFREPEAEISILKPAMNDLSDSNETNPDHRLASGFGLAIVGTFLFALKSIFIKLAFAQGVGAIHLLTIRMVFALPFYVVILCGIGLKRHNLSASRFSKSMLVRSLVLGFLGYYLASMLDFTGLQFITAQLERLTLFTYPAMISVLAWLYLGESLGPRTIAAIVLTYGGVLLMYGQERAISDSANVSWGVALVFGAALSYSLYVLLAKPAMQRIGSRSFTSLAMIGSTFFVVAHYLCVMPVSEFFSASPIVYFYGLILALVCTVLPSFMINEAILRIGATRASIVGSLGPAVTMILAILVLGEPSSVQHFVGMFVAIVGVSLVARK